MLKGILRKGVMVAVLLVFLPGSCCPAELTARQILDRVDDSLFPKSFIMKARMINYESGKKKNEFLYNIKANGDAGTLMAFEYPQSEIGKKFLFKDRNIWMAIPGVSNPIRLSPKQNFMGSSFSNNDLMDTEFKDDYDPVLEGTVQVGSAEAYKILCTATNPKVTYYKVIMMIEKKSLIPVKFEYYTRSGKLLKTLELSEVKQLAGRARPTKMVMKSMLEEDAYTAVIIETIEEKVIPLNVFSLDSLRK